MFTCQFSRLPAIATRILILLAILPWIGRLHSAAQPQPGDENSTRVISSNWTAAEWDQVVRMVQADLSAAPARLAGTWDQRKKLIAADAVSMVGFGWSVDVDGDILVVGASNGMVVGDTGTPYACGTAYVFQRSSFGWSSVQQVAKLSPADYVYVHGFGLSVAIDGDYIVIGAPDSHKPYAGTPGAAYLFKKNAGGWEQIKKLAVSTPADGTTPPRFGYSVDIAGNLIAVGAPMEDQFYDGSLHTSQGSAYVFQIPAGDWPGTEANENAILTPTDGRAGDMFGASLAVSGNTVIASAYGHAPVPGNPAETAYGKVYVFSQAGAWEDANEVASFTASDAADHEYFGWDVAIDGGLAVVGAPGDYLTDANGEESVYLFVRPVSGWTGNYTETARLVASDGNIFHDLGTSVAVSGNVVVAGAPGWDVPYSSDKTGAIYIFEKPVGGWVDWMTQTQKLLADDHTAGDEFGHAVAIDGTAIAVGVPRENARFGAAYMFDSAPEAWLYNYLPFLQR